MKSVFICLLMLFALPLAKAETNPCAKDIQTLCKDVKKGQGRILNCLKEHEASLSPECKAHGEKMKQNMTEIKNACHDDAEKFCKGVEAAHGGIMKCMKEHREELSDKCKSEVKKMRSKRNSK